jgi:hypothetical protein
MIGFCVYSANQLTVCGRVLPRVMLLLYTVEEILVRMICEVRPGITKALNYFTMLCTIRRLAYTSLSKANGWGNGDFAKQGDLGCRIPKPFSFVLFAGTDMMFEK